MRRFKLNFFKFFLPLAYLWWRLWSRLYRKLTKLKRYKGIATLPSGLTPSEAQQELDHLKWQKDGFRQLWDVVAPVHWVQHCINTVKGGEPQPEGPLDCDEFAAWACSVIDSKYSPHILVFSWINEENKPKGHAVCLYHKFSDEDGTRKYGHVGNWGHYGARMDLDELVSASIGKHELIGWGVFDYELDLVTWGTKLPDPAALFAKG